MNVWQAGGLQAFQLIATETLARIWLADGESVVEIVVLSFNWLYLVMHFHIARHFTFPVGEGDI